MYMYMYTPVYEYMYTYMYSICYMQSMCRYKTWNKLVLGILNLAVYYLLQGVAGAVALVTLCVVGAVALVT